MPTQNSKVTADGNARRMIITVRCSPRGWLAHFSDEPEFGWVLTAFTSRLTFSQVQRELEDLNPGYQIVGRSI